MANHILKPLLPPEKWRLPVLFITAVLVGLAAYTLYLSKAHSYMSDDPKTCVNCHIMGPQYASWSHSSHREVTNCNDCHVPHNNAINKYYFKAKDGLRHSYIFTLRLEPQVIKMHEPGQNVVQDNCVRCHSNQITDDKLLTKTCSFQHEREERQCWECHREVPHGRVKSLSSTPYARVPTLKSPVPTWLKDIMDKE